MHPGLLRVRLHLRAAPTLQRPSASPVTCQPLLLIYFAVRHNHMDCCCRRRQLGGWALWLLLRLAHSLPVAARTPAFVSTVTKLAVEHAYSTCSPDIWESRLLGVSLKLLTIPDELLPFWLERVDRGQQYQHHASHKSEWCICLLHIMSYLNPVVYCFAALVHVCWLEQSI